MAASYLNLRALFYLCAAARSVQGTSQNCWQFCLLQDSWCRVQCQNWHFQTQNGTILPNYVRKYKVCSYNDLICVSGSSKVCNISLTDRDGNNRKIPNCVFRMCPTSVAPRYIFTVSSNPTPDQKDPPNKNLTLVIICVVVGAVVAGAVIAGVIYYWKIKNQSKASII